MENYIVNIMTHVLDDHPMVLKVIERCFEKVGIKKYKLFQKADDFLKASDETCHIAVIDYLLNTSDLTGVDVCKKLIEKNPRCYVIIMSGQGSIEVVIDMLNSGAKKYVPKWEANYEMKVAEFVQEGIQIIKRDLEYYQLLLSKIKPLENAENTTGNN